MKIEEAQAQELAIQKAVYNLNKLIKESGLDVELEVTAYSSPGHPNSSIVTANCTINPAHLKP